jgi:16S rRNA processing protein RimM
MIEKQNCRQIGIITKVHGVGGEVVVRMLPGFYSEDVDTDFLFLELDGGLVPFGVTGLRDRGDNSLLVELNGITREIDAKQLVDSEVWVALEDLVEGEAVSPAGAVIGYKVVDEQHGYLGEVIDIDDPERNPLFVIENKGKEILVPVADEFIVSIDDEAREITLRTPDGLIDLND